MPPASARTPFGLARVVIGVAMVVVPRLVGELWWGQEIPPTAVAMLRGLGARDAVIGAGTALVDASHARPWVRAGVVADAADALAAGLASELPAARRWLTIAFAASGVAAGVVLDRALA